MNNKSAIEYIMMFAGSLIVAGIIVLLFVVLTGCYSERKAKQQFSKAAIAYPKLPADYCAITYPVKDSTIRDTLLTTDTLYIEGQDSVSTVYINDTIRTTIIKTLPAKIITNTIHIRDTIIKENTALVKLCEINRSQLTDLLVKSTAQVDKYKGQSKKRGFIMWGLILLIIGYVGARLYSKTKKINI